MKLLGNIIWFLFGGFVLAIGYFILGLLLCATIVGIPFGLQVFKLARLALAPFGKEVKTNVGSHIIMNIIWLIFVGIESFFACAFAGVILCLTIIGIPFGLQAFKFGILCLTPFGATING